MLLGPIVIYLLVTGLYCGGLAFDSCGRFTYHHNPTHDDQNLSDALEVKETPTRAECFSDCFHHRYCNRLLYNELTNQCHLHSSEESFASQASGFKYYEAECTIVKSPTPPTCPHQFAPFASTGLCYDGENWVDGVDGSYTCQRIEWLYMGGVYNFNHILPTPVTPGFVLDIRGTWANGYNLQYALGYGNWALIELLVISGSGTAYSTSEQVSEPSTTLWYTDPLPITAGEPFDMQATFNSTHYQIFLDGTPVGAFEHLNLSSSETTVYAYSDVAVYSVSFKYP